MNDKIIQKAVECYIEKLRAENKILKEVIVQIADAFTCDRSNEEIVKDISNTLRVYGDFLKEVNYNDH